MAIFPTRKTPDVPKRATRTQVRKITRGKLTWYDFSGLTDADVKYLQKNFRFHPLDFEDLTSSKQRPKLDEYDRYLFIIFHVPFYDRRTRRLVQEEVDVFIGQDYLVTVHSGRLRVLNDLFAEAMLGRGTDEWLRLLDEADIPVLPMHTPDSLIDDPHLAEVMRLYGLWRAQTPQMFRYRLLDEALAAATDPNLVWDVATKLDAAGVYEQADIDAAEGASDAVKDYCSGAVSEAQRLGCEWHVTDGDLP